MSNNNTKTIGQAPWLHVIISTGLGTGFVPFAPGTAGALLALAIWIGLYFLLTPVWLCIVTVLLVLTSFVIGIWTDNVMERYWGEDPRAVVIDEFFGTWIACLAALFYDDSVGSIILATLGFALFRVIDIFKPLGCRWVDKHIHGGLGCMLDDALAATYALVLTLVIRIFVL